MESQKAPYDARIVANLILDFADRAGISLTQIQLLKILYFCQGWFLVKTDGPLFFQPVESWKHGPVVQAVRDAFKKFGSSPITDRAERLDIRTGELLSLGSDLDEDDHNFVKQIFKTYSVYGAWRLSDMTHEVGSPWDRVWNSTSAVGRFGLRIRNEDIKSYFASQNTATAH